MEYENEDIVQGMSDISFNSVEIQDTSFGSVEMQDTSFGSVESTQSNLLSEISVIGYGKRLEFDDLDAEEPEIFEPETFNEPENFEELENPTPEFPNDAYKDLMLLVTNHKLNNKAGNAIIRFFNKYSNISKSPLPKNIEKGREFMNKMNYPNLKFNKICIANYNGKEYFLHYQDLESCVKNILSVPDITRNFTSSFKNYKVQLILRSI